ncbi:MAG: sulfatase-like hydrolase/transferase, partial [Bacteroidaceae bacterium]|nr:sulfatase-like hydrolase/transferase [Bacteroidaceae bacterium]
AMGLRGDAIAQFDWTVGRVTRTLDSLGIRENTLIILSSDNGPVVDDGYDDKAEDLLGSHKPAGPYRGMKYSAFEGGSIVPCIVNWKGHVEAGQTSDALISQIDWLTSLAKLTGTRIPRGAAPDSEDHISTLLGYDRADRDYVIEFAANHTLSIRDKRWKYITPNNGSKMITWGPKIETGNDPEPQLYDMTAAYESDNQACNYPDIVERLKKQLEAEKTKTPQGK